MEFVKSWIIFDLDFSWQSDEHKKKGQLDPYHYNFLKLDFMLKSMPLSGMILNIKPNFTELWWHESNFP